VKQQCLSDDFIAINDDTERFAIVLYAQRNRGERELDSRETERECVCMRGRAYEKEGSSVSTKINRFT
jgi:hypothetical protein